MKVITKTDNTMTSKINNIQLNLDISEVNQIIKALSSLPFREVYELIGKIHGQSNNQLKGKKHQLEENSKK